MKIVFSRYSNEGTSPYLQSLTDYCLKYDYKYSLSIDAPNSLGMNYLRQLENAIVDDDGSEFYIFLSPWIRASINAEEIKFDKNIKLGACIDPMIYLNSCRLYKKHYFNPHVLLIHREYINYFYENIKNYVENINDNFSAHVVINDLLLKNNTSCLPYNINFYSSNINKTSNENVVFYNLSKFMLSD